MDGSQPKLEDLMSRFPSLSFVEDGKKVDTYIKYIFILFAFVFLTK